MIATILLFGIAFWFTTDPNSILNIFKSIVSSAGGKIGGGGGSGGSGM
ncbi:hypothetical protein [Kyrpidia spormannii]|nr:hypothetical protein [Kyrpidia spormannii]